MMKKITLYIQKSCFDPLKGVGFLTPELPFQKGRFSPSGGYSSKG